MKHRRSFQNNLKSYALVAALGLLAGVLTRLTDFFPADSLWSLSSIATLFGFWMVTVTLVVYYSASNISAGLNAFLFLFFMDISFYGLQSLLGRFLPRFDNGGFKTDLFLLYAGLAAVCGVAGAVLYCWNRGGALGAVLYALPVGGLLAETLGVGVYCFKAHTYLFQLLFDLAGALLIGQWFFRKTERRGIYTAAAAVTGLAGYSLFYRQFL